MFGRAVWSTAGVLPSRYVLLTTPRAAALAPGWPTAPPSVHHVEPGRVDELAAALRPQVRAEVLVALGGGRVIDVAKALAAADPPRRVAAIPTTLFGGRDDGDPSPRRGRGARRLPRVRAAFVINDPELSASQRRAGARRERGQRPAHAFEGPLTPLAQSGRRRSPPDRSVRLIAAALTDGTATADRDALALGALLAGYVIDSTGYGLHHVLSQTLVRFAGVTTAAPTRSCSPTRWRRSSRRAPGETEHFRAVLDEDPARFAGRVCALTGVTRRPRRGGRRRHARRVRAAGGHPPGAARHAPGRR